LPSITASSTPGIRCTRRAPIGFTILPDRCDKMTEPCRSRKSTSATVPVESAPLCWHRAVPNGPEQPGSRPTPVTAVRLMRRKVAAKAGFGRSGS
jgi:hypothetical protein